MYDRKNNTKEYGWNDYEHLVKELGERIREGFSEAEEFFKQMELIAIGRGGCVPALILSHQLNIPYRRTVHIQTRMEGISGNVTFWSGLNGLSEMQATDRAKFIFVDDLIDSGRTIQELFKMFREPLFAAPIGKPAGLDQLNVLGVRSWTPPTIVADDIWVKFPWESEIKG